MSLVSSLQLTEILWPDGTRVWTSLEGENPGGSIKDHMVLHELRAWLESGRLRPGQTVAEVSAGSTARSLAHYARELGLRCVLFLPTGTSAETLAGLQSMGAEVHLGPADASLYAALDDHCAETGAIPFDQFKDRGKRRHYERLGREVAARLGRIDLVLGAVGTGHSLLGLAAGLEPRPRTVSVEPLDTEIEGVRNLERLHFGDIDPCSPDSFDERILVEAGAIDPSPQVLSSDGPLHTTASFELVLAGARARLDEARGSRVFLIGAANRRARRSGT